MLFGKALQGKFEPSNKIYIIVPLFWILLNRIHAVL